MQEPFTGDGGAGEVVSDDATDRQLRDTFGVTEEGLKALTARALEDKARDALHPRIILKGRAGSHRTGQSEKAK